MPSSYPGPFWVLLSLWLVLKYVYSTGIPHSLTFFLHHFCAYKGRRQVFPAVPFETTGTLTLMTPFLLPDTVFVLECSGSFRYHCHVISHGGGWSELWLTAADTKVLGPQQWSHHDYKCQPPPWALLISPRAPKSPWVRQGLLPGYHYLFSSLWLSCKGGPSSLNHWGVTPQALSSPFLSRRHLHHFYLIIHLPYLITHPSCIIVHLPF